MERSDTLVDELTDHRAGLVALANLFSALLNREFLSVWAGSQVAEPEKVGNRGLLLLEFGEEVGIETAQLSFHHGVRVVSDESSYPGVELDGPEPTGPIERVKAGFRDRGRVSDVMECCSGYQGVSIALSGQQGSKTSGLLSYCGDMPPPTRQRFTQLPLGERSRFVNQTRLHPPILTMGPANR